MDTLVGLPEIGELTAKLGEALTQLNVAKLHRDQALTIARDATDAYRQLFGLVEALQKEIHDAISVCLRI